MRPLEKVQLLPSRAFNRPGTYSVWGMGRRGDCSSFLFFFLRIGKSLCGRSLVGETQGKEDYMSSYLKYHFLPLLSFLEYSLWKISCFISVSYSFSGGLTDWWVNGGDKSHLHLMKVCSMKAN